MFRASLFAVLVSVSALAQERVRVAVHPIVAPGVDDPKLISDLNREVQVVLAGTDRVTLVASEDVEKRLAEEGGKCPSRGKERTDCLERVALATRAVYIIAVTVKRLGREYELSGMIADADRVLLEQPEPLTVTDNGAAKIDVALKHQLRVLLLERMKAGALPTDPRMRNPPPSVVLVNPDPGPAPPPPGIPTPATGSGSMSTIRLLSLMAGGFAVVCGVVGLSLGLMARSDASGLSVSSTGVLLDPSQVGKVSDSRNKATLGAAFGAVAGVAAVAAVMMYVLGPAEEPKTAVGPVVFSNGGGIAFSGVLP